MTNPRWQLPDGVDELLPPVARQMEHLRREVLDVFHRWGFDLIDPPLVEYLDSLLVTASGDMDLQTLKSTDQRSGRLLGVRTDFTSQAIRVDAQHVAEGTVSRLCYAGPVVFANPVGVHESRVPLKAGAEIFGVSELTADAEIIALMLAVLEAGGLDDVLVVLGHMGIFKALLDGNEVSATTASQLFDAVQLKSEADIAALLPRSALRDALSALPGLMGDARVLDDARAVLGRDCAAAGVAIDALEQLSTDVRARVTTQELRYDLSELTGFGYHTGPIFAAYHRRQGRALARGGRFDGAGDAFGAPRPATGFDVSLRPLLSTQQSFVPKATTWVSFAALASADAHSRSLLWETVDALRADGRRVVLALNKSDEPNPECDSELRWSGADWSLVERPLPA
ncbi:MAG: ATP phosphoribosyltransferase regulatory subunit [Pseudomonadota bacterium]